MRLPGAAIHVSVRPWSVIGLMAYGVSRRTQEIGVRLALGAQRGQILALVLAEAARLVTVGALVGVPAAWAATGWVQTLLFGVTPADPSIAAGAVGALVVAACVAAYLPARRAAPRGPIL